MQDVPGNTAKYQAESRNLLGSLPGELHQNMAPFAEVAFDPAMISRVGVIS